MTKKEMIKERCRNIELSPEEIGIKNYLQKVAEERQLRHYQQVSIECCNGKYDMANDVDVEILGGILTHISEYEFGHDRPLLSVVVINKADKIPGNGFWNMCQSLEYFGKKKTLNRDKQSDFFTAILEECYDHWGKK